MAAEAFTPAPERLHGAIIIEWPAPSASHDWPDTMDGRQVTVRDAGTGARIFTATGITVHADLRGATDAELVLYTGLDGTPLLDLAERPAADGRIKTGAFLVRVAGMRVREA